MASEPCGYCRGVRLVGWSGAGPLLCPECSHDQDAFTVITQAWREQRAEVIRLSAELSVAREMREVLREIEWVTHQGVFQQWSQCPCCDNERSHNHTPDCRLARLIGGGE